MRVARIAFFGDTVFALLLVLLILQVPLPDIPTTAGSLHDALADRLPEMFGFFVSAGVVGGLWLDHHRRFDHVERRTDGLLRLNLAFLICVVFLWFPAGVLAQHIDAPLAALFFAAWAAVSGLLGAVLTHYVPPEERRRLRRISLAMPVAFVLSAPVAFAVVDVGGTEVSLAPILWVVALPAARRLLGRSGSVGSADTASNIDSRSPAS